MAKDRDESFVNSPMEPIAPCPASPGYRGGAGEYNGEDGWPKRTPSPNAADEKTIDGNLKGQAGMPREGDNY